MGSILSTEEFACNKKKPILNLLESLFQCGISRFEINDKSFLGGNNKYMYF